MRNVRNVLEGEMKYISGKLEFLPESSELWKGRLG